MIMGDYYIENVILSTRNNVNSVTLIAKGNCSEISMFYLGFAETLNYYLLQGRIQKGRSRGGHSRNKGWSGRGGGGVHSRNIGLCYRGPVFMF